MASCLVAASLCGPGAFGQNPEAEAAASRAAAILEDAGIDTYDVGDLDSLAERVQQDLTHAVA